MTIVIASFFNEVKTLSDVQLRLTTEGQLLTLNSKEEK